MRDVVDRVGGWYAAGKRVALGRVVGIAGSAPRTLGATVAVNDDGEVAGSVSGGCVEGAVIEVALSVLADRDGPPRLVTFGPGAGDEAAVALTCGGTIDVFVEHLGRRSPEVFEPLRAAVEAGHPAAVATVIAGPHDRLGAKLLVRPGEPLIGCLGDDDLDRVVARDALGELAGGRSGTRHYGLRGEARQREVAVFVESYAPPPRMVILGAVDFTAALVRVAKVLGYHVTVCDARAPFATTARFPEADEVVCDWPHRHLAEIGPDLGPRDAVCLLTHDPKFDVPAVFAALGTDVGYLGAMGSRRTNADRLERLASEGVDARGLRRLMAPIGLDIGARTPEETAVAICAEIIALRSGHPAPSLRDADGPIHR